MPVSSESQAKQRLLGIIHKLKADLTLSSPLSYRGLHDPVAHHLNIQVKHGPLPLTDEGWYNSGPPPEITLDIAKAQDLDRLSFTYFHEITHHLIRADDEIYSFLNEYTTTDQELRDVGEPYCNFGAAEFLTPAAEVRRAIYEHGFTITLVETLDHQFCASKPAIALQLAHCASHRCFVVICEYGVPPSAPRGLTALVKDADEPHLYVIYSAGSAEVSQYRISRYTGIPRHHLLAETYAGQQGTRGKAMIPFRNNRTWECECESFFYKGRVYAVFNASPPPLSRKHQLAFSFDV